MRFSITALATSLAILTSYAHANNSIESDALVMAQDAMRQNNYSQILEAEHMLSGSILAPYPRYWWLLKNTQNNLDQDFAEFLQRYPNTSLAERMRIERAKLAGKNGDWARFREEFAQLDANFLRDGDLECYRLLDQYLQNNRSDEILSAGKASFLIGKGATAACISLHNAMRQNGDISSQDIWQRIQLAITAKQPKLAVTLAGFLGENLSLAALAKPSTDDLQTLSGRILALAAVQNTAAKSLTSAKTQLENLIAAGLPSQDAAYIWGTLGLRAAKQLSMWEALQYFERSQTSLLDKEQWEWWARAALRTNQWQLLLQITQAMPPSLKQDVTWQYWQARALLQLGRIHEAQTLLRQVADAAPRAFYGLMAMEELGESPWKNQFVGYVSNAKALQEARLNHGIIRALSLFRISEIAARPEFRDEARREWRFAMRNASDGFLLASAEVARQAGFYEMAIYSADRTKDTHDFALRYLSPFPQTLRQYAQAVGVDFAWVHGLIRQESRFVHLARSHVGASGYMQIMPATGRWIAGKLGVTNYSINDIDTNLRFGTWYLRHVQDSLSGNAVLATAAYNAGPGRARRWQDAQRLEGAIYAETIPFNETRDYVKKVMSNAVFYSFVFGNPNDSIKKRMGSIPAR